MPLPTPTPARAVWTLVVFLAHFHASEFALAVRFNPRDVGWHSFLLSRPYVAAMGLGAAEFGLERAAAPERKAAAVATTFYVGVLLCIFGEWLRKTAMFTAGSNFTHVVQTRHRATHILVTDGVYAYARHPGYLGWFFWALGTQVILANAVSVVVFAIVTWRFFSRRIRHEEAHLRVMFPEYATYARRVPTWIPGIP